MIRGKITGFSALGAAAVLTLAGCSGSSLGSTSTGSYGAGITSIVNPSSTPTGGTLTFDLANHPDSTDYQNTYDSYMWDFVRLYSMQLMTYESCPGACGTQLVPDLATAAGTVSHNGLVWTYHIKRNVKFENGQTVTAQDVKYGIERTYARSVLPYGPTYFQTLLQDPSYPGPYVNRTANVMGLTSVTTPNSTTIQFHLQRPFADFNYVVATPQSTPVQPAWDTGQYAGANFQLHPESTGPYRFQSYTLNKKLVLVKNPYWRAGLDPQAEQLVSKIVVNMNLSQAQVDNNVVSNAADMDLSGAGVQTAAVRNKVLGGSTYHANVDDAMSGFVRFAYINLAVIPNIHCREAIEYAADKTTIQDAWGGPITGGAIASTVMPPTVLGYQQFDLYNALSEPNGDIAAAKQELKLCGKPHGFTTGLAYRTDRPQEVAAAQALQASLATVGIKTHLDGYLSGEYYTQFAGVPAYVDSHDLGIDMGGWSADWPDGYGFLTGLSNGDAIASVANTNISDINSPSINALFARAANDNSEASRLAIWTRIDKKIMGLAAILPMVYQKVLLYRNPNVTNVYVDSYYGMYNYAVLGLK
jgi:peptide/nickel transport system substrate-binding protein